VKIAVVGCGAVGSFYGAKLARAGHEVHFLLRSDYQVVCRQGVQVKSPDGDFQVRPRCAAKPEVIGGCDLVLVALKSTANDQFPNLIPPLVHPRSVVLTLQNGLGNEEDLARVLPADQIMGGLCFVCLNRIAPGVIHHISYGQVTLGDFSGNTRLRTEEMAELFRASGVPCLVAENLGQAHWEKLVWNVPFNGLGVASSAGFERMRQVLNRIPCPAPPKIQPSQPCLTTDRLLADPNWHGLVRELMLEVIATARGIGFSLGDDLADKQIARTYTMGGYRASTLIDFERGQPLELEHLFLAPWRQARRAEVAVPRLSALCAVLQALDKSVSSSTN
jgi:2-dehydropantoate 2-reductase